ncbi:hypothetical protein [Hyphococcus sp.]
MMVLALTFALSACGKKAPLRAPDEPQDQSLNR